MYKHKRYKMRLRYPLRFVYVSVYVFFSRDPK